MHVNAGLAQGAKSEEQESYTEEEITDDAAFLHVDEDDADEEGRIDEVGNVERESERHDPSGQRGSDVCTHDDGYGLGKCEQACVHKRNGHQRGSCTRLHGGGDEHTRQHACETVGGHGAKDVTQLRSGHFLKALAH